jgi:hypothetical protein
LQQDLQLAQNLRLHGNDFSAGQDDFCEKRVSDYWKVGVMSTRADNIFSLDNAF